MNTALVPFQDIQQMATAVAKSGLFGMKTPEQAIALMLVAQSEGLHPARAAMEYHVIQGRPALKADAMLARFQNAGGKVSWKSYTDADVTGVFSHPSGGEVSIQWTFDMATKAGLTKNPTWKQYPRAMLRARCISEGIRTVYPGVSVGIYTPEEVQDFTPAPEKDVTPQPAPTPMPEKVKQAAAKAQGKTHKPDLNVIEGEATHVRGTISGNPLEGDLTGIGPDRPVDDVTKGKVLHAFASVGYTLPALEAEYGKPLSEWMESDVVEARELLKSLKISAAQAKAQAAEMAANPDGGEI
jgi:hypothetical protein